MDQGSIIRTARLRRRISQGDVAAAAGVSTRTVMRAEGGRSVAGDSLRAICAALDIDAASLPMPTPAQLPATDGQAARADHDHGLDTQACEDGPDRFSVNPAQPSLDKVHPGQDMGPAYRGWSSHKAYLQACTHLHACRARMVGVARWLQDTASQTRVDHCC